MALEATPQAPSRPSHLVSLHPKARTVHRCQQCDRDFINAPALQEHLQFARPHKNEYNRSPKTTASSDPSPQKNASRPRRGGTGSSTSKDKVTAAHLCKQCKRSFFNEASLKNHLEYSSAHKKYAPQHSESSLKTGATQKLRPLGPPPNHRREPITWTAALPDEVYAETMKWLKKRTSLYQAKDKKDPILRSDLCVCKNCGGIKARLRGSNRWKKCTYHTKPIVITHGKRPNFYPCCKTANRGCQLKEKHQFGPLNPSLEKLVGQHLPSPSRNATIPKRSAVVMDCEMVGVVAGANELGRVCLVDFYTGETLIDKWVEPLEPVIDWRTRYSGLSLAGLSQALEHGAAVHGWAAARELVWDVIDDETIIIGQALENDLTALRMAHERVVDLKSFRNAIIDVAPECKASTSLKSIAWSLLGIAIQNGIHDVEEDTFATREVMLTCMKIIPRDGESSKQKNEVSKADEIDGLIIPTK